jgi:hypothetical protein
MQAWPQSAVFVGARGKVSQTCSLCCKRVVHNRVLVLLPLNCCCRRDLVYEVQQQLVEDTRQRLEHLMAMEHEDTWTQVTGALALARTSTLTLARTACSYYMLARVCAAQLDAHTTCVHTCAEAGILLVPRAPGGYGSRGGHR